MAYIGGECSLNFPLARISPDNEERIGGYKPKNKCYKPKTNENVNKLFELLA